VLSLDKTKATVTSSVTDDSHFDGTTKSVNC
jgi:hypothetical protein